ncbi:MAG: chemotaxis protein CheA [Methanoregula sp.]|nr:chemotaxis protein CheA [Methanoregula sp.]MDD5024506.1 chemotaxis protein CheA [Methanoregula sp.]
MSEFEAYRGLFVAESRENHENLVRNLLLLEEGTYENTIDEIFRSLHTLKGASASMGFSTMEHLCHTMEDVFSLIRNGSAEISSDLINLLLACSDLIEQMLDDIESGGDSSQIQTGEQVTALKQWFTDQSNPSQDGTNGMEDSPVVQSNDDSPEKTGAQNGEESRPQYDMRITVAADCQMKDVRAMLVLENLDSLGTILSVHPSREAIDEGKFDGQLRLSIASDAGEEALRTAASGSEIATIEIKSAAQEEEPVPEESVDAPKTVEAEKKQTATADKTREIKNLRVDIHQLDHIMNLVEDLVINRGRLKQIADQHRIKEMDEAIAMVDRSVSELQNQMMIIRMIPLNHIFNRLPRVVRDVAQYDNKEVEFVMEGGETELDRSVMDGLNDPLLHLIRNAVNHGIESPEERKRAGKPQKGFVKISAYRDRDNVIIQLSDDGAGINVNRVKAKAIEKGLITPEAAETFTTDQAIDLLFQPGFSTADKISDISGRGVGLDVVKKAIEALKGTIRVETTQGQGSRFELLLPPTMAIVDVMIVKINGKRLGIPISSIVEVANFQRNATHRIGKGEAILLRNEVIQILWLTELVGESEHCEILIVVQYQKRKCCIPVDIVEGKQEVVVKPLSSFIGNTRGVSGVTILGDGTVVPVLDVNTLV